MRKARSVHLNIGNSAVRVRFAGGAMQTQLWPATAHLETATSAPTDLTIDVWDSASTGVTMPPPPWSDEDYAARGEIQNVGLDAPINVAFHPGSGMLSLLHKEKNRAVLWMADAAACPYYEQAAPMRTIFHWWCTHRGQQLVHGAAVGTAAGAVLLTGRGGSGKSTTAINCLLSGLDYLGDDYVLCDLAAEQAHVYSVYNSAKMGARTVEMFPQLRPLLARRPTSEDDKGILLAQSHFRDSLRTCLPLRAVMIPSVTDAAVTQVRPIKPALAFLALTPTTVFQLPGAREAATAFMRRLVLQLPCYQLLLGRDMAHIPSVIQETIEGLT